MRLAGKRTLASPRPHHSQDPPVRWSIGRIVFFGSLVLGLGIGIRWVFAAWFQIYAPALLIGAQVTVESRTVALVRTIDVAEAANVNAGQPVVQLDDLSLTQQMERQQNQISERTAQLETEQHRVDAEIAASQSRIDSELERVESDWLSMALRRSVAVVRIVGLQKQQGALITRVQEQQDLVALGALTRADLVKSQMESLAAETELESLDQECVGVEQSMEALRLRRQLLQDRREIVGSQIRDASRMEVIAAELQSARDELTRLNPLRDEYQLRAPVSGVVHRIYKRPGEVTRAGEAIMEIVDPIALQLEAYFSQPDLAYCVVGSEVSIDFGTGLRGRGQIAELRPRAESLPPEYRSGFEAKRPTIVAIIRRVGDAPWPSRINVQATVRLPRYRFNFWSSPAVPSDDRLTVRDALVRVIRR